MDDGVDRAVNSSNVKVTYFNAYSSATLGSKNAVGN